MTEPLKALLGVRPWRQALPRPGELVACCGIEALRPNVVKYLVQRQAVELVEVGPRQLTAPDAVHRGHVQRAPGLGQPLPVGVPAAQAAESPGLGSQSRAPV